MKRPMDAHCAVCHGEKTVTEMTDGRSMHMVCDDCREFVNVLFFVHRSMATAVKEAAQAKRGIAVAVDTGQE